MIIKKIKWRKADRFSYGEYVSILPFGELYKIGQYDNEWGVEISSLYTRDGFKTLRDAKAYCQKHFEKSIKKSVKLNS